MDPVTEQVRRSAMPLAGLIIVLAVLGVAGSVLVGWLVAARIQGEAAGRFERVAERAAATVQDRLRLPLYGLAGARGLFVASKSVERDEFRAMVMSRDLAREFPGVRGFGVIKRVQRADLDVFVAAERADAGEGFTVRTAGNAPDLYVITSIEPLANNRPAWGFDVGSEARRRAAAETALRSGQPSLTRAVVLVQDGRRGPGFLIFMPIYANGTAPVTEAERTAAFACFVYCPIVVGEIMAGLEQRLDGLADVLLHDGPAVSDPVIFDADGHSDLERGVMDPARHAVTGFERVLSVAVADRTLALQVRATPAFLATVDRTLPLVIAVGGSLLTLLAALIGWQAVRLRTRSIGLARSMTRDLAAQTARAEAALHEAGFLNRTLQEHALVTVTDPGGRITDANAAYCRTSGWTRDELIGRTHAVVGSGTHGPEFWAAMWADIRAGRVWRGEICNRAKDGTTWWMDLIIAPYLAPDGTVHRYVSLGTDITQRKLDAVEMATLNRHLERQTAIANDLAARAELATVAKSAFLANMSHEIRTPMNGVLGMTELLLGMGLNPQQDEVARTVYRSAESLLAILNDILDFSKIEAGRMELEAIPFDLRQVVGDVAALFRGRLAGGPVELVTEIDSQAPHWVRGDPVRLRQILTNLVGNAVKFTRQGTIRIRLGSRDGRILLVVADTGIGITQEQRERLFQPFTQADASTARQFGGTGLGLAISRRLAEAMGGSIDLVSEPGCGTEFSVVVPLPDAAPQAVAQAAAADGDGGLTPGLRVLLAEDNPVNQRVALALLGRLGCQVVVAGDGRTAVERFAAGTFDAVLMDCQMPEMDGYEATAAIRAAEADGAPHVPIIALTANASPEDRERCLLSGMDDHLAKPFKQTDLMRVLRRWVAHPVA
ncbi:MAG: Signal transduction histidine-protein kinase BarA [Planctomycetota bacterium]|jgi:PAS domain S-box-containing protein